MSGDTSEEVRILARWLLQDQCREPGEAVAIAGRLIAELAVYQAGDRDQARHIIDTVSRQLYSAVDEVRATNAAQA